MAPQKIIFIILLPISLAAHQLTIHSDYATATQSKTGYKLTHHGKITVTGDQIDKLTCSHLTLPLDKQREKITAHNACLQHGTRHITATRLHVMPNEQRMHAHKKVHTTLILPTGQQISSSCAHLVIK